MRIIARRTLREFWTRHPAAERPLRAWFAEAKGTQWRGPADIKARYPSASLLADNRVVLNIGGNRYRLVVAIRYDARIVFIRFIGTHQQYDRIDVASV
jgi:mRNA interferase HigB